jgi:hypothetical protein
MGRQVQVFKLGLADAMVEGDAQGLGALIRKSTVGG